jgi:hypothetical protein
MRIPGRFLEQGWSARQAVPTLIRPLAVSLWNRRKAGAVLHEFTVPAEGLGAKSFLASLWCNGCGSRLFPTAQPVIPALHRPGNALRRFDVI